MTDPGDHKEVEPEDQLEERLREVIGSGPAGESDVSGAFDNVQNALDEAGSKGLDAIESLDDTYEERLRALEERSRAMREKREDAKSLEREKMHTQQQEAKGLGVGISAAYTILGLPLAGIAIGWFFDRGSDTRTYMGVGALVGSVVGVTMALYIINRANSR